MSENHNDYFEGVYDKLGELAPEVKTFTITSTESFNNMEHFEGYFKGLQQACREKLDGTEMINLHYFKLKSAWNRHYYNLLDREQ
jgi:hypothetical protein